MKPVLTALGNYQTSPWFSVKRQASCFLCWRNRETELDKYLSVNGCLRRLISSSVASIPVTALHALFGSPLMVRHFIHSDDGSGGDIEHEISADEPSPDTSSTFIPSLRGKRRTFRLQFLSCPKGHQSVDTVVIWDSFFKRLQLQLFPRIDVDAGKIVTTSSRTVAHVLTFSPDLFGHVATQKINLWAPRAPQEVVQAIRSTVSGVIPLLRELLGKPEFCRFSELRFEISIPSFEVSKSVPIRSEPGTISTMSAIRCKFLLHCGVIDRPFVGNCDTSSNPLLHLGIVLGAFVP